MSAFPVLPWTVKSRERWLDDREIRRATNGKARGLARWDAKVRAFELDFAVLSDAEKAALEAHYDAHRTLAFDFVWRDGQTYLVVYGDKETQLGIMKVLSWSGKLTLEQA